MISHFFCTVIIIIFVFSTAPRNLTSYSSTAVQHSLIIPFIFLFFPPEQEENGQRKDKIISISFENVYVVEINQVVLIAKEQQFTNESGNDPFLGRNTHL